MNDTWAFSVRIFSNDAAQVEAEAFTTTEMQANIQAWTLDVKQSGDTGIGNVFLQSNADDAVYDLQGRRLTTAAQKGILITNGRKYVSR